MRRQRERDFGATINGWVGTVISLAGVFIGVPATTWLATRFGKRRVMLCGLTVSAPGFRLIKLRERINLKTAEGLTAD